MFPLGYNISHSADSLKHNPQMPKGSSMQSGQFQY